MVLGLLLSGNVYAATKFTYLSCKKIIKKNNSKAKEFSVNNDYLKIGANNGYYFYKFKDDEKKSKVRIYEQGISVDRDWRKKKPKEYTKGGVKWDEFNKSDHIYTFVDKAKASSGNILTVGIVIQKINGEYYNTTTFTWFKNDINYVDLIMDGKCSIVDKKKFNKLIKNGI